MANKKVTDFTAATSADLTNSSTLMHIINPDRVSAAERNLKVTRAQARVFVGAPFGSADLASSSVTNAKIADYTIDSEKYKGSSVDSAAVDTNAVTQRTIRDGAVDSAKLASSAVTTIKIKDGAVSTLKLADDSVSPAKTLFWNAGAFYAMRVTDGGVATNTPSGWTVERPGGATGRYRFTHNLGASSFDLAAVVTPISTATALFSLVDFQNNYFDVVFINSSASTFVNTAFSVFVVNVA